jgi:curved DNA-binding protein CbpA
MANPYRVLGVSRTATTEEINRAYRRLCKEHHPDKHLDMKAKERHAEIFKKIQTAYDEITSKTENEEIQPFLHTPSIFRFDHFDRMFEDIEKKMKAYDISDNNGQGTYYSKQTYTCTRNGKTVTKIEENINGDINHYESYDSRPINRHNKLSL